MIGTSLHQYRIIASIGAGGTGEVFRARHSAESGCSGEIIGYGFRRG